MQSIGNKILEAARAKHPKGYHPRVIMTAEDFARLRDNRDNGIYKLIVECVLREADKTMDMPPEHFRIPDGIRLLFVAQEVQRRVIYHSLAYHITGEEKYAARAVKEIEAAAAFPDFNPRHFLDCSEMTLAFGLCFDWLYDYLTEEKKKLILDTIAEKSFFAIKEEFDDVKEHKNATISLRGYRWYQDKPGDNWKMVCDGSFVATILAIHDAIEDDFCETILTNCFEDTYQAVRDFYDEQDGTYSEGVNYWTYATRFLAFFSKALETAAGSDFGLTDYVGVARSPYWLFALSSPDYMCFNFGDAHSIRITSPMFSWIADRYNDPALYAIRKKDIEAGRADYMDALYFRDVPYVEPSSIPLSFGRVGGDNASFRTDIGEKALYAAIHLAKNHAYHGHRDMGTFVVNIGDKRFFVDLGADNYNLAPGYGMCYRYRAEGHNTVIFNPSPEHDQARIANCVIHRFSDGEESFAISDMSEAYPGRSVLRGMKLCRADQSVIIQDEIECKTEDVIRWSAHTPASVRLYESGQAAVLDIDGVKMYAKILTDGVFEVRAASADENSPVVWNPNATEETPPERRGQALNNGTQKLMIHLSGKSSRRIAVWLKPLAEGEAIPAEKPAIKPLALW